MKKGIYYFLVVVILTLAMNSCKSTKDITKSKDVTEIKVPLSGKEYRSNKKFFRAKSSGRSVNMAVAKKIAIVNAKAEIAGLIRTKVKVVTVDYTKQRTVSNAIEFGNTLDDETRLLVNEELKSVAIIGEKILQLKDGSYQYWVAIEISKDDIMNGINNKISKDKKLQLDYDKHKFKQVFDKEMEKFEKDN